MYSYLGLQGAILLTRINFDRSMEEYYKNITDPTFVDVNIDVKLFGTPGANCTNID